MSSSLQGYIVGIEFKDMYTRAENVYRVLIASYDSNKWEFEKMRMTESDLIQAIRTNVVGIVNAEVKNNKIVGTSGSLDRFRVVTIGGHAHVPYVIVSEIRSDAGNLVGYKVATFEGEVKNILAKELIKHCIHITEMRAVPIQNAQLVNDRGSDAFLRCYPQKEFFKEILATKKENRHVVKAEINRDENKKAISKLEEIFTPDQIKELKLGRVSGVDIKIYANKNLKPEQMRVIREALEEGLNAKLFADPRFSVTSMRVYKDDLKYGVDITEYLNPKYSAEQINELGLGVQSGIDIARYSNPELSAEEMAERRLRLEKEIWKSYKTKKNPSWE